VIGVSTTRYSHDLIMEQGESVVNSPGIGIVDKMHVCEVKPGKDTGLTPVPAQEGEAATHRRVLQAFRV
jgi:flavin reductase (DIM6/NTAB) family NADH-FMN oxidoreductase RutF